MANKSRKSVLDDAAQVELAISFIELDARLQVLESETNLSRERLIRLYKEIKKKSPPKGMLPFSTDWFLTWQPNIHSSLFLNIYENLTETSDVTPSKGIVKAYKIYREQISQLGLPEVLSMTRAWRLVKFFDADMLTLTPCTQCGGHFVSDTYDLHEGYVCGLCNMPSRAGKTAKNKATRFFNEEAALPA